MQLANVNDAVSAQMGQFYVAVYSMSGTRFTDAPHAIRAAHMSSPNTIAAINAAECVLLAHAEEIAAACAMAHPTAVVGVVPVPEEDAVHITTPRAASSPPSPPTRAWAPLSSTRASAAASPTSTPASVCGQTGGAGSCRARRGASSPAPRPVRRTRPRRRDRPTGCDTGWTDVGVAVEEKGQRHEGADASAAG